MTGPAGWAADPEQIRAHAAYVEGLRARFDAVRGASAHIARDDQAYGLLCGWISAILEDRHTRQDELVAYVDENLRLVADGLRRTADSYDGVDGDAASSMEAISRRLRA
ncbi:type VII secretion target [Micromonospora sp. NPDC005305]|uniref:type VII secretion target n=1 Tax=Micromonospora sp. NPDC005305 TaxID=3156875 RepID=UPI0033BAE545